MMKNVFKTILSKLPIYIFCVVFISGYSLLFGSENSTVGVASLTMLLTFLQSDLGVNTKQGAAAFPIMMLVMGIAPKIASYNIYIGFFIHFAAIMFLLIISSYNIEKDNHVPFLLGYIFCEGYSATGAVFDKRLISLLLGGILLGLMYLMINKKKDYSLEIKDVFKAFSLKSYRTQWYIKLAFGLSISMFLGEMLQYPRTIWINFAILSLTHHHKEERVHRMKHRLPATIIGSVLFFLLFGLIPEQYQMVATMSVGFMTMFLQSYQKKTIANSFSALVPAILIFPSGGAVFLRILSNAIGVVFAYVNHKVFDRVFEQYAEESVKA